MIKVHKRFSALILGYVMGPRLFILVIFSVKVRRKLSSFFDHIFKFQHFTLMQIISNLFSGDFKYVICKCPKCGFFLLLLFIYLKKNIRNFEWNSSIGSSSQKYKEFELENAFWSMSFHVWYLYHALVACLQAAILDYVSYSLSKLIPIVI